MVLHAVSLAQMDAQGVADANSNAIIGHGLSFLVGRVSYTFGLQVGATGSRPVTCGKGDIITSAAPLAGGDTFSHLAVLQPTVTPAQLDSIQSQNCP